MGDIDLLNKVKEYNEKHCYQYQKRLDTLTEDLELLFNEHNITQTEVESLRVEDFDFAYIESADDKKTATEFIKKYEWLGTVGSYPTHWFKATYKGLWGGVVIMGMPNSFSKLLGDNTKDIERLIARGASASWTPKNLGSCFVMWCIKWMVSNTNYRLFTAYSDPQARELGTIYQALNFFYLGRNSGATIRCINPYNPSKIITDRAFRARSFYKKYAKDLGIAWQPNWCNSHSMLWENIPDDIERKLREYSKRMFEESTKIEFPQKGKYAFVLGRDKRETKLLRKTFLSRNKIYEYPKSR